MQLSLKKFQVRVGMSELKFVNALWDLKFDMYDTSNMNQKTSYVEMKAQKLQKVQRPAIIPHIPPG